MGNKIKQYIALAGLLSTCFANTEEVKKTEEPIEIVETEKIEPNVVTLARNEVRYTDNWENDCSDNTITINYQDAQLLMMVAAAEAGSQGVEGMKKVMQVILNRVADDSFPNTIQEVVYQPSQFESVTNGSIYTAVITADCHQALAEIEKNLESDNSIFAFETSANGRTLQKYFDYSFTSGDHDFYTLKRDLGAT